MAFIAAALADIGRLALSGQEIVSTLGQQNVGPDFYTIRMEIGNNQDAGGNPPSIILTDFSDTQKFSVFEGTSKASRDMCRNNKDLPLGDFDSPDLSLFRGLKKGEAPVRSFKTANGYNLKTVDFQGGGNSICISNLIFKGSETQARRDEIFIPIGDIGFLCGREWNWGTVLNNIQQRCVWLDGDPEEGRKPMSSLRLNMEKIAGIFNADKTKELAKLKSDGVCALFSDSTGLIPNRNDCNKVEKREVLSTDISIDKLPLIDLTAKQFTDDPKSLEGFAGAGFVTSDNKIYDNSKKIFVDASPPGGKIKKRSRHFKRYIAPQTSGGKMSLSL